MSGGDLKPLMARLAAHPRVEWLRTLRMLSHGELHALDEHWPTWAHDGQLPGRDDWSLWLIRAGRGFGKTRAGAEWVSALARANGKARIALVGGSIDEVRAVMVEGTSGLIALCRHGEAYEWRSGIGEFTFSSGAKAFVYSAEAPEKLRGPEHHAAWCDELAKWRYGEATWDNLMLGLRLGERPQVVVTTTPQPNNLMRRVMAIRGALETRGGTYDNAHLPAAYIAHVEDQYAGTRFGRQELDGELIEDVAGALWSRDLIERQRVAIVPPALLSPMGRVVVGVDPPAGTQGDACGIVAVALGRNGHAYVLEDASVSGLTPEGWAQAVAACAARHGADRVVAEKNQGGAMVESVLRAADDAMPLKLVHAVDGKGARAEPVSLLYERGRVWHAGRFAALEDELCGMTPHGYEGPGRSPDRADALVWAVAFLMLGRKGSAGVRGL